MTTEQRLEEKENKKKSPEKKSDKFMVGTLEDVFSARDDVA